MRLSFTVELMQFKMVNHEHGGDLSWSEHCLLTDWLSPTSQRYLKEGYEPKICIYWRFTMRNVEVFLWKTTLHKVQIEDCVSSRLLPCNHLHHLQANWYEENMRWYNPSFNNDLPYLSVLWGKWSRELFLLNFVKITKLRAWGEHLESWLSSLFTASYYELCYCTVYFEL